MTPWFAYPLAAEIDRSPVACPARLDAAQVLPHRVPWLGSWFLVAPPCHHSPWVDDPMEFLFEETASESDRAAQFRTRRAGSFGIYERGLMLCSGNSMRRLNCCRFDQ